jgi:CHRD domain-containing protein
MTRVPRKRLPSLAVLALAAGLSMVACRDDGIRLTAALRGDGTGTADIEISSDRSQICWDIQGLAGSVDDVTAMHIHSGAEGDVRPVVVDFISGNEACTENVSASVLRDIAEEPANFYVEVHSERHPDGATRGQLEAASR